MKIFESIVSRTIYPVRSEVIERICIECGVDKDAEYEVETIKDSAYRKAVCEYYKYLATLPSSISENGSSISISENEKLAFSKLANEFSDEGINSIYGYKGSRL